MSVYLQSIESEYIYGRIREVLHAKNLVLFAGSGLSAQACTEDGRRPPLWKGLLEEMIRWCVKEHLITDSDACEIQHLVTNGFLIEAGQELQEVLEQSQLHRCLTEALLCNEAKSGEAHRLIVNLPFRAYLTTNYDDFIENEFIAQKAPNIKKFYERSLDGVLADYREGKHFILKVHGDISDPSSIILGNRSYERLLYANNNYLSCLETIFAMSSVLFIGFSGSDPDLEGIISRVAAFDGRSKRHWMLVPRGSFPALKAKRFWKDKGISTIEYEKDATHSGLVRFLRVLSTPIPGMLVLEDAEDQNKVKSFDIGSKT